jgi:L-lactate utilization protein LutB
MGKEIITRKINDTFLRRALKNFAAAYPVARAKAFDGVDFEALRGRISESKKTGLKDLPELVSRFKSRAEQTGAKVHVCSTPEEANRTILNIIRSKGADFLVKSKAMTSEEFVMIVLV